MRILLLYNPISGAGKAADGAQQLGAALRFAGHEPRLIETRPDTNTHWLDEPMADVEAAVILGGDGAVRLAAGSAARTSTPIYQFPSGTENLFARQFAMTYDVETLLGALERFEPVSVDLATINTVEFVLMTSLGFDAEVVHDLAARRRGAIRRHNYLLPMLRQMVAWRADEHAITVDSERIDGDQPGFVVVANCRCYGFGFDPARHASMTDGKLDVVFFPTQSRWQLLQWMRTTRRGQHIDNSRLIYRHGREVTLDCPRPRRAQLDGDRAIFEDGKLEAQRFEITVRPGVLPVLR